MTALADQVTRALLALEQCDHRAGRRELKGGGPGPRVCVRCTDRARLHLRTAVKLLEGEGATR